MEFMQRGYMMRHWPLMVAVGAWLLVLSPPFFLSEIVRAVVAVVCVALMAFQWLIYRKSTKGADFVFLSLVVVGFGLANFWLALNVARFYTYAPESDNTWAWHTAVVRLQTAFAWATGILAAMLCVWGLLRLARWLTSGYLRIQWMMAVFDWVFAISVSLTCGGTLYRIRSGQFPNNWVADPEAFAHMQELGILLAVASFAGGLALLRKGRWPMWVDTLLLPPKAYCAYYFLWNYAMSGVLYFFIVPAAVLLNTAFLLVLWSRHMSGSDTRMNDWAR